jgi:NitT/TauT family transport system substrate-binding protein
LSRVIFIADIITHPCRGGNRKKQGPGFGAGLPASLDTERDSYYIAGVLRGGPRMKIRIGHLSTFYHTSILLLAGGDADARMGVEIEWRLMGTGPAIMNAFEQGELDLAYIGLPPAIIGMDRGVDVACVAGGHMEGTIMAAKSGWKDGIEAGDLGTVLGQFRGRKIGVPGKGSIHDGSLRSCLEEQGLEREITIVNYPWADLVLEAVVRDEVSAAVGTPALAVAIKRFAGGRVLWPASGFWPHNPSYGIVADRDFLSRETETVERFLRLHEDATASIRARPHEAARLIAAFVAVVDEDFVMDTLTVSPKYCAKLTEEYITSTIQFVPVLMKMGYIKSEVSRERIFSPEFIGKVHPEKEHYNDGIARPRQV